MRRRLSILSLAMRAVSSLSLRGGDALRASGLRMLATASASPSTLPSASSVASAAFELVRKETVAEYNVSAVLYRHRKTGAEVLSIAAPHEQNKVFGINFKTLPKDDTGVPHILEHSVLCGSRRYPSKEPFVELLKGSLKTFLNAFTMADRTCYPVASQNTQDFYNLVDVYLDSVLHPRLGPNVLKQEGWSYQAEAGAEDLKYKGVVFNEMKGVYSSADSRNGRLTQRAVFRDHPIYSVDSGGDPVSIPALSYEAFEAFHKRYYHPSNARIFFYGDDDPEARLAKLEEFLGEFGPPVEAVETIPIQPRAKAPYEVTLSPPILPPPSSISTPQTPYAVSLPPPISPPYPLYTPVYPPPTNLTPPTLTPPPPPVTSPPPPGCGGVPCGRIRLGRSEAVCHPLLAPERDPDGRDDQARVECRQHDPPRLRLRTAPSASHRVEAWGRAHGRRVPLPHRSPQPHPFLHPHP